MNQQQFHELRPGDIVRHVVGHDGYIVTGNYGDYVVAVRTIIMGRPEEWTLVKKVCEVQEEK